MFLRLAALFIKIQMNIITGLLAVIKQWGKAAQSGSSKQQTFSFPTSFSQVFAVLVTQYGYTGGYDANSIATSVSNSAVTLTAQKNGTYILAIGK